MYYKFTTYGYAFVNAIDTFLDQRKKTTHVPMFQNIKLPSRAEVKLNPV